MGNFPYPSSYMTNGAGDLPAYPVRVACDIMASTDMLDGPKLMAGGCGLTGQAGAQGAGLTAEGLYCRRGSYCGFSAWTAGTGEQTAAAARA